MIPEDDPAVERDQAGLDRGDRGLTGDPQTRGRPPQQCRIARGVGRGEQKQPASLGGEIAQVREQGPRCAAGQRTGEAEPSGQLRWRYLVQYVKQRPGNPSCLGKYLIPYPLIEGAPYDGGEKVAGVRIP